jgi:hypothetical protein
MMKHLIHPADTSPSDAEKERRPTEKGRRMNEE